MGAGGLGTSKFLSLTYYVMAVTVITGSIPLATTTPLSITIYNECYSATLVPPIYSQITYTVS